MNQRTMRSLVISLAIPMALFMGHASLGAAQACDPYLGCDVAVYPGPVYGPGCDPYLGCPSVVYPGPVYGPACDPYLGCNVMVYPGPVAAYPAPPYGPGCDPYLDCCDGYGSCS